MELIPPLVWVHIAVGIVGTLIMLYTFGQRDLKERLLVSEVLAATVVGVLMGPAATTVLDPSTWLADSDLRFQLLQEIIRLVLAVQLVSATLSLPVRYVERQWKSLFLLLGPTLLLTWGTSFAIAYLFFPDFGPLPCLLIAACLTPTDPVLASTVLQGKFAEKHLPPGVRNLLSAESVANDGAAFPLVMLPVLLMAAPSEGGAAAALGKWVYQVWLYQVGLAIIIGILYGFFARWLQWYSDKHNLQDEPSFLAHIIGLAFGTVGFVRAMGADGVLAVFTSALAFSSREPTAEEGRYDAINGIELILVISFFILFGSILPMKSWASIGIIRLLGFGVAVIFLRRLPIMLALGRYVPELNREPGGVKANFIQSWFVGFYGPIGVGALFYTTLSQEELGEQQTFQVVTFVVLMSVLIHGISAAPLSRIMFRLLTDLKEEGQTGYSAMTTGDEGDLPADGYRDDPNQQHMQP